MRIDLNADLGEAFGAWRVGDDDAMLDVVTSANVACGFHAGDPSVMVATCKKAAEQGVVLGAHVAYRDLAGFGRHFVDLPPAQLRADVLYQISALLGVARVTGAQVAYVKPHGALYHRTVTDTAQARAVVDAVAAVNNVLDEPLALVGLPGSVVLEMAEAAEIRAVGEAFADRGYQPDGTLVPHLEPDAVLTDPEVIAERVVQIAQLGTVTAVDGSNVDLDVRTVRVHGDTPGAVEVARRVRAALEAARVDVACWA